ncbi:MAG TPA: hypothetical protein VEC12_06035 [Bacteroidia bacterium]|nr:hypothetical protein [Bacteroidia bacterium]
MRITSKLFALPVIAFAILASSCKKYEDGPIVSFRSKEQRIANTWKVESAYEDGNNVTSSYNQYELQMLTDGKARLAAVYTLSNVTFEYETDGRWELINDKEDLKLDFEDNEADRTYQILRLKEKQLWIREKGGEVELHLTAR